MFPNIQIGNWPAKCVTYLTSQDVFILLLSYSRKGSDWSFPFTELAIVWRILDFEFLVLLSFQSRHRRFYLFGYKLRNKLPLIIGCGSSAVMLDLSLIRTSVATLQQAKFTGLIVVLGHNIANRVLVYVNCFFIKSNYVTILFFSF